MIQKFFTFVLSLIGIASALTYEHVDFRPEISTELSTVLSSSPNPDNPDNNYCPCDKRTGIITHGDGHKSKCPCTDGECGCSNKGSDVIEAPVETITEPCSECGRSCDCLSKARLQIPTPSATAIEAVIREQPLEPMTIPVPLIITEEPKTQESVQSTEIITVEECVDGSCTTTTTYSGPVYSNGPTYRKGPLGIFWWRVRR